MQNIQVLQNQRPNFISAFLLIIAVIVFFLVAYTIFDFYSYKSTTSLYLIPWSILAGVLLSIPSLYLYYKKTFNPFHPLVYPFWTYFFPGYAVGGLILAFDLSRPYFLVFVQDETFYLPLTLMYICLGYLSLAVGFYMPYLARIGNYFSQKLPKFEWSQDKIILPAIALLLFGFFNNFLAFAMGVIGYQQAAEIGTYNGIIFMVTLFWMQASFLLWLVIFRTNKLSSIHYVTIALLIITSFIKAAFQGNRGSLITIFIFISFAFITSGKKITYKHKTLAVILGIAALTAGMIYGSTFRSVKSIDESLTIDQYAERIFLTFELITEQDTSKVLFEGFDRITERVESVSQVAVIVSNYEKLSVYESGYGLDNNIIKDTLTYLIPRVIWNDKPLATDTHNLGDLYFEYRENSFTLTPIGDLIRNFGPWGIPIGMIILGIFVRLMYSTLMENQPFSYWRATIYYMLLTSISYEGSYGLIIPYLIKVLLVAIIGILFINLFAKNRNRGY